MSQFAFRAIFSFQLTANFEYSFQHMLELQCAQLYVVPSLATLQLELSSSRVPVKQTMLGAMCTLHSCLNFHQTIQENVGKLARQRVRELFSQLSLDSASVKTG